MSSLALVALCTLPSKARADVIKLLNDDLITGDIIALTDTAAVIKTPIAAAPLKVSSSAIKRMTFASEPENTKSHSELITLANGDALPCNVLSMDKENVNIATWYAGNFQINRKNIRSLRFGLSEEREIYTGGDAVGHWGSTKGTWTLSDGVYNSKGSGVLARELDMPENVRIRFDFAWKEQPNFVFRFCSESDSATTKQDTYEFTFNSAGMQIRRYQDTQRSAPIANIDLKPHAVEAKKINLDFRINRSIGALTLYIDGKKTETWHDVLETAEGNHIIFNNRSSSSNTCIISNILVSDWNDGSPTRHLTKIGPTDVDVLLDNEGDKRSGHIASIKKKDEDHRTIQFDTKHSSKPLMVPDHRVSILYFAQAKTEPFPKPVFTAELTGYGNMQLEQPLIKDGKVSTKHPILGNCTIDPKMIASIYQSKSSEKNKDH